MNRKIYVSGPITGLSREEYIELFGRGARLLAENGDFPLNPTKMQACPERSCNGPVSPGGDDGEYLHTWGCYLRYDLIGMLDCDGILMLPGWRKSRGAMLEFQIALAIGMPIFECAFEDSGDTYWQVFLNG